MKDPYLLATLQRRVDEQQARWQAPAAPGHVLGWLAAEAMIDQGRRAVCDLELYANPPAKRKRTKKQRPLSQEAKAAILEQEDKILHDLGY